MGMLYFYSSFQHLRPLEPDFTSSLSHSGLMESMRAADANNWSLNPEEFATLATSLNNFFQQTGLLQEGGGVPGFPSAAPPGANSQTGNGSENHGNAGGASPNSENGAPVSVHENPSEPVS